MNDDSRGQVETAVRHCLGESTLEAEIIVALFLDQRGIKEVADQLAISPPQVVALRDAGMRRLRQCQHFWELLDTLL
jgi:DNA-directed RNA polymerase specialized sigma subunit